MTSPPHGSGAKEEMWSFQYVDELFSIDGALEMGDPIDFSSIVYISPLHFNLVKTNTNRAFDDIEVFIEGQYSCLVRLCRSGKIAIIPKNLYA